jgi:hypothetical protein
MKYILFFALIICFATSFAQNKIIKGQITDSLHNPLSYANIVVEKVNDSLKTRFFIADEKGYYRFNVKTTDTYKVTVYYLGYKPQPFIIKENSNHLKKNIILRQKIDELEEVVIKFEIPVVIKEDTITYNVKKFATGRERKLKDLLKKLPGMEVNRKGEIVVMGKEVRFLLVDNKPFFGGSTKLGVENIPSNIIDKIEIIEDYSAIPFMKGLNSNDITVINIKLKKDKKKFYFGDLVAGGGNDQNYLTKANVFYYSPTRRLNLIANLNNIGEQGISIIDILRMSDLNLNNNMEETVNALSWIKGFSNNPYYINKTQKLGAFQIQNTLGNTELNAFYIILTDNTQTLRSQTKEYLFSGINESISTQNRQKASISRGNISLVNNLSSFNNLRLNVSSGYSTTTSNKNILSFIHNQNNYINKEKNNQLFSFTTNLVWHKKFDYTHTIKLKTKFNIENEAPDDYWSSSNFYLNDMIDFYNNDSLVIIQNTIFKTIKWRFETQYFYSINLKNHLYTTIGNYLTKDIYNVKTFQQLSNNNIHSLKDKGFDTDINRVVNDAYIGVTYKTKINKTIIRTSLFTHHYYSHPSNIKLQINRILLLPDFSLKTKINYTQDLLLKYKLKNQLATTNNLTNSYYFKDYAIIYKGDPELIKHNNLTHNINFRYKNFNIRKGFLYYINLRYSYNPKPIKDILFYYTTDSYITTITIDNPQTIFRFSGQYKKIYTNWYASIKFNGDLQKYTQIIQSKSEFVSANNNSFTFSAGNKHDKFPNFDTSITWSKNERKIEKNVISGKSFKLDMNFEYEFLKNFFSTASYRYVSNISEYQKNSYNLTNFSIIYNKSSSPWSFEIKTKNIFDTPYHQRLTINEVIINDAKSFIKKRVIVFTVNYKL